MRKSIIDFVEFDARVKSDFKDTVIAQIWKCNFWSTGQSMFSEIVQKAGGLWDTKVRIVYEPGSCAFDGAGISRGARLKYDPDYAVKYPIFEPTQNMVRLQQKTYIYLFHELIHFYHYVTDSYVSDYDEEFRATGLYRFEKERYSENAIRKDASLPRRPCYAWQRNAKNQFDYDQEQSIRKAMNLPSQMLLDPRGSECMFR
jgi:hypothetical protein